VPSQHYVSNWRRLAQRQAVAKRTYPPFLHHPYGSKISSVSSEISRRDIDSQKDVHERHLSRAPCNPLSSNCGYAVSANVHQNFQLISLIVWIKSGICTADSLINILLCTLGYIPGLIHAWYIISLYPELSDHEYETIPNDEGENGRVTYYYVNHRPNEEALGQQRLPQGQRHPQQSQRGYGTTQGTAVPGEQQRGESSAEGGVPPSYEQAVKGDHKVQT